MHSSPDQRRRRRKKKWKKPRKPSELSGERKYSAQIRPRSELMWRATSMHKEVVGTIKKSAIRNEQRITRALMNSAINCAMTPSPPPPLGTLLLKRSQQQGPRKCYMDEEGRVTLMPVAEVDRLMRERSEREKAA